MEARKGAMIPAPGEVGMGRGGCRDGRRQVGEIPNASGRPWEGLRAAQVSGLLELSRPG